SVVKELVENSLDAKAIWVEVEIQEGGSRLIKVTDNGEGMSPEDAQLAVQKHATSKIYTVDDLSHLHTFGFRGEALASIASVSHFELSTRVPDALSGVSIKIKGGSVPKTIETGRPPGTTITISNLFYNTPARLKFMKKQSTEENHIVMVMTTYALAFPQVGFKLTIDGKESLNVSPSEFTIRLSNVFGKELSSVFLPVDFKSAGIQIKGVVSAPTITKPTRENMLYFVNRRWISNPSLGHAVMTAFHTLLPTRRFPVAVLFIELPEDQVDVNVHPTKKEVKFAKDRDVYEVIVRAIRSALLAAPGVLQSVAPTVGSGASEISAASVSYTNTFEAPLLLNEPGITPGVPNFVASNLYEKITQRYSTGGEAAPSAAVLSTFVEQGFGKGALQAKRIDPQIPLYNFSQLFNTFIVFQSDSEMFIADQHTVHERLNYERLMQGVRDKKLEVQPLLVPVTVELSAKEAQVLKSNM
ncbi:MAG TPA: DNA mismatch repair endonuclease MutL, partial [bacterium]